MKVILTTNVKKLGKIGDQVTVKPGFARNYLFPNNMALRNNKKNAEYYERIKEDMQKNEEIKLDEAKKLISNIKKIKIIFNKEADEKDQLYGSISKKEILLIDLSLIIFLSNSKYGVSNSFDSKS